MPNSFIRLLTEYAAIPKMPVTASIAPIMPNTPSEIVAIREAKQPGFQVSTDAVGSPGRFRCSTKTWED